MKVYSLVKIPTVIQESKSYFLETLEDDCSWNEDERQEILCENQNRAGESELKKRKVIKVSDRFGLASIFSKKDENLNKDVELIGKVYRVKIGRNGKVRVKIIDEFECRLRYTFSTSSDKKIIYHNNGVQVSIVWCKKFAWGCGIRIECKNYNYKTVKCVPKSLVINNVEIKNLKWGCTTKGYGSSVSKWIELQNDADEVQIELLVEILNEKEESLGITKMAQVNLLKRWEKSLSNPERTRVQAECNIVVK